MIQALFISVKQSGVFKDGGLGWVVFLGSAGQTVRRVTLWARVAAWRTGTHSYMAVWLYGCMAAWLHGCFWLWLWPWLLALALAGA